MTVAARSVLIGYQEPRLSAATEGPDKLTALRKHAKALGIRLLPWQEYALKVMTSGGGPWQYRETATVVARQNGKTKIIAPLVRLDLEEGRRVLHTAQNRIIPRRVLAEVAPSFSKGEVTVRYANGQEEIRHRKSGGRYTIVAPQRGIRGHDADRLIVDEIREFEDFDFIYAAEPTLTASAMPQVNYFSNAGHELSVVLNDLRGRAGKDAGLAYLEWSADPELHHGDPEGWAQANPSLGHLFDMDRLDGIYQSKVTGGNLAGWETEHLCRWVVSMAPRLVQPQHWAAAQKALESPSRPAMGVSVTPDGSRASAVLSWPQGDGSIGVSVLADVTGSPIDPDLFAADLRPLALEAGVYEVAFDPWTDQHLARYFDNATPITGQMFANATERFVRAVETGQLHHANPRELTDDLGYTARKYSSTTAFTAERADPKRPITAVLAAIRAVWIASKPDQGPPSVY